ncbi:MAG: type II CAAX prenyl endopeptidase Rce1 family protein, partial [Acidobacteriota bacterium]
GALFAWILHRSGSLWPAIGLHAFLNLWWMVAHGEESRGLSLDVSGLAQVASIVLALALTVRRPGTRRELVIDNR